MATFVENSLGVVQMIREYFDRVYVINLPERTDRRRDVSEELARAGLPLEPGKVEIFNAVRPADPGGFPNIGTRGCFLSHYRVLRQAREQGLRNVLIVEDDLAIAPRFRTDVAALVEQLTVNNWGFVYFGHLIHESVTGPFADGPVSLRPCDRPLMTTHFLGVNGPILDRLVQFLELVQQRPPGHPDGGPMPVDGAYSTFREQNPDVQTLLAIPNLGVQRSSRSDITAKWFDHVPGIRGLADAARRGKSWLMRR